MSNSNYTVLVQQSNAASGQVISVEAPMPDSFAFDVGASYQQMLPQGLTDNTVINTIAAAMGTRLAVQAFTAQLWAGNTESNLSVELEFHTESDPVADVRTPIVNLLKLTMPSISTKTGFLNSPGPYIDWAGAGTAVADAFATGFTSLGGGLGALGTGFKQLSQGIINEVESLFGATPTPAQMTETNSQSTNGQNNSIAKALQQNPSLGTAKYWNSLVKNKISIRIGNYLYFDSVVVTNVQQTFASNFDAQTGLPHNVRVALQFKPLFMLTQEDLDDLFLNPAGNNSPTTSLYGVSTPPAPTANSFGVGNNQFNFTQ